VSPDNRLDDTLISLPGKRDGREPAEVSEVIDITEFQKRFSQIRQRNHESLEATPREWARKVSEIKEHIQSQRAALEEALLEQMLSEEDAMIQRLEDLDRNLRNMIRLYRQLVDERNAMVSGLSDLHRWIREVETKQKRKAHADHGIDLAQKSFIEYMSKQAWVFDNSSSWAVEDNPRRRRHSSG
jgi:hypothetical protein